MDIILSEIEARVLGSLIEKELSTPEYYPLSLNALVNACNQKNNRDPVTSYDETAVAGALVELEDQQLAWASEAGRVPRHGHGLTRQFKLVNPELAVLAELLLRGPQTVGELRTHTERLHQFPGLAEVEEVLAALTSMKMAEKLPRQPGRKESRYAHLWSGQPKLSPAGPAARPEPAMIEARAEKERVARLEEEMARLTREFEELKRSFLDFKAQFE